MRLSRITIAASGVVMLAAVVEGVWALLQLLGVVAQGHALYPATGTFYNPGPLCGFMAVAVPVAAWWVWRRRSRWSEWTGWGVVLLCAAVMPALMGRTGWIAAAAGVATVWSGMCRLTAEQRQRLRRWGVAVIAVVVVVMAGLYMLKPESAKGRLLMWHMGMNALVAEGGWHGIGWERVAGALGRAQEAYFMEEPRSAAEIAVAGAPDYAFNEFLQAGIAYGWIGLILLGGLAVWTIWTAWRGRAYGIAGGAVALVVVCCGSYPLQFGEFYAVGGLLMAGSAGAMRWRSRQVRICVAATVMAVCLWGGWQREMRQRQGREWQRMRGAYVHTPLSERGADELLRHGGRFGWSHRYLFDAGKALRESGRMRESDSLLLEALERSSDPMILNLLGRNAQDRGDAVGAEVYFKRAAARIPSRLYPRYLLARLYADSICGPDTVRCRLTAEAALAMEVKVESPATRQMREELRGLLEMGNEK